MGLGGPGQPCQTGAAGILRAGSHTDLAATGGTGPGSKSTSQKWGAEGAARVTAGAISTPKQSQLPPERPAWNQRKFRRQARSVINAVPAVPRRKLGLCCHLRLHRGKRHLHPFARGWQLPREEKPLQPPSSSQTGFTPLPAASCPEAAPCNSTKTSEPRGEK